MDIKNIPLDFADKLKIVGERLNDYIAKDMGTEIYDIITEIVAPLTYDKSNIELIINDGWKSFNNYTLKNYYWDELAVAYDELIPKSIKDEISKIDNNKASFLSNLLYFIIDSPNKFLRNLFNSGVAFL